MPQSSTCALMYLENPRHNPSASLPTQRRDLHPWAPYAGRLPRDPDDPPTQLIPRLGTRDTR